MNSWMILSTVALVYWGITGVTQKLSTNHISFERAFLRFALAFLALAVAILFFIPLDWHISPSLVALAGLGGLLNGFGALTSFAALEQGGKASIVNPLVSVYPLVTIGGAWLLLGERLTWTQVAGVLLALGAVALLAQEPTALPERKTEDDLKV